MLNPERLFLVNNFLTHGRPLNYIKRDKSKFENNYYICSTTEINFFDETSQWINHVEIAEWADCILIAPLTANTLAKMANGICDSLLLAVYFSAKSKTIVAPAMDLDMYQHPTVKENLSKLTESESVAVVSE